MKALAWEVVVVVGAVVLLGWGIATALVRTAPSDEQRAVWAREEERDARAWADRIGIRINGVECNGYGSCTIGRDDGPVAVRCSRESGRCALEQP